MCGKSLFVSQNGRCLNLKIFSIQKEFLDISTTWYPSRESTL